ncbi:serine/threonine protein kinase [Actinorugispora endophytica]|uniref:Serine/threonine protein kinase n=2 Tax=Actinorugispora endophytica TaxID=1605990 RepID=A0A4R6UIZ3_9ACTN|nr:serine/threonine protein kinase [Actinorugispora endophytica]
MPNTFPADLSPLTPDEEEIRIPGYRLLGRLGEGGMGVVYAAIGAGGRPVALKLMRPETSGQISQRRQRFRNEIEALRSVRSEYTIPLLDEGFAGNRPWLVTPYVPGRNLQDQGRLSAKGTLLLARVVADALRAIHVAGFVHRDLKPSNVIISRDKPVILDFGIALSLDGEGLTETGSAPLGTTGTISPERYRGEPGGPPADVFAWGCLVVFAATGHQPFAAENTHAVIQRVLNREPAMHDFTGPLADLALRAMAKNPDDRPTAQELLDRARALAIELPAPAQPPVHPPVLPSDPDPGHQARFPVPSLPSFPRPPFGGGGGSKRADPATLLVLEMQDQHADPRQWWRENLEGITLELRRQRPDPELARLVEHALDNRIAMDLACAAVAARLAPHVRPRYRGRFIDEAGLVELALGDERDQELLRRLLGDRGVFLDHAARHTCAHLTCVGRHFGRGCRILREVRGGVADVVAHTTAPLRELRNQIRMEHRRLGSSVLLPPDSRIVDRLYATALLVRSRSTEVDRHRAEVLNLRSPSLRWWASQQESVLRADPNSAQGLAWIVIASVTAETARRFGTAG